MDRTPYLVPALLAICLAIVFFIAFVGLVASQGLMIAGENLANQVCTKNDLGHNICYDSGGSYNGVYPTRVVQSTLATLILTVLAVVVFGVTRTLNHEQLVRENKPLFVKAQNNAGLPAA